jgi:hypothetical protein
MKGLGFLLFILLTAIGSVQAQTPKDTTFSVFFNGGVSYTHANDPHINRWLSKYGYPTEPHIPKSYNFEFSAIPASSRFMFSAKISTIASAANLTSFNLAGGVYYALIKSRTFFLFAGLAVGYHKDIITLNGNLPPAYQQLATEYNKQLSLRRDGLFLEPLVRAFWFPITLRTVQIGLYGGLGADMDLNSGWKLGYYDNSHGKYNHFKGLTKPTDQQKASEHGVAYNIGLSVRFSLH